MSKEEFFFLYYLGISRSEYQLYTSKERQYIIKRFLDHKNREEQGCGPFWVILKNNYSEIIDKNYVAEDEDYII